MRQFGPRCPVWQCQGTANSLHHVTDQWGTRHVCCETHSGQRAWIRAGCMGQDYLSMDGPCIADRSDVWRVRLYWCGKPKSEYEWTAAVCDSHENLREANEQLKAQLADAQEERDRLEQELEQLQHRIGSLQ